MLTTNDRGLIVPADRRVRRPRGPVVSVERQIARSVDRGLPDYLTRDEAQRMLATADKPRDRLLIETLWNTGGRISEVLVLRRCDFYGDHLRLLNEKQGRYAEKAVFVRPEFALSFLTYCEQNAVRGTDFVFTAKHTGRPMTRQAAWLIIRACAQRAGIVRPGDTHDRAAWPHLFRHGYAVNAIKSGVPIKAVQKQLGHASILTTNVYLQLSPQDIKDAVGRMEF